MSRVVPVVGALWLLASQGFATPVVWSTASGGNGHTYEFIRLESAATWDQANAEADDSTLDDGSVGYLATVTSAEEQAFIQSAVLPSFGVNKNQVWIGGRQDPEGSPSAATAAAGWQWIVNVEIAPESWSYTNWLTENEPSNEGDIDERFLTMWVHYYEAGQDLRGKWNDEKDLSPSTAQIIGMIVEWSVPSVPEPSTAALSALGVALLALYRRRA
ncbi:MAG: PEP-CTERM sorting domain-containing protein [Myxococcota bacterium]